jgi:hypothetical protein
MQLSQNRNLIRHLLAIVVLIGCTAIGLTLIHAQSGTTVTINGTLQVINGDGTIVVDGMTYRLGPGVTLPASARVGTLVVLGGQFTQDSILIIVSVSVESGTPAVTAAPSPSPTPPAAGTAIPGVSVTPLPDDGAIIVVVEGPVRIINVNIVTIYDINVMVAPDNPLLKVIHIGDFVRARGHFDGSGVLITSFVTNVLDPSSVATVSLDGKVQAIKGNILVINDMNVQVDPGNVILAKLKVGDKLHVDGNFQTQGTTIIIIVINITIINNVIVIGPGLPPGCKISKNGHIKCSKKAH